MVLIMHHFTHIFKSITTSDLTCVDNKRTKSGSNCDIVNLFNVYVLAYPDGTALNIYSFYFCEGLDTYFLLKLTGVYKQKLEEIVEIMDIRQAFDDIKARLTLGHKLSNVYIYLLSKICMH